MATTAATPANCPACGMSLTLLQVAQVEAHFIAHMLVFMMQGLANSRDSSADW